MPIVRHPETGSTEEEEAMLDYIVDEDATPSVLSVTFDRARFEDQLLSSLKIARREGEGVRVQFKFNGRTFVVCHDTNPELMYRDFWLPLEVSGLVIGPYPDPTETDLHRRLALARGSNFARRLIN